MAIDYKGQVTTTGLLNQGASRLQVPDMSKLTPPEQPEQPKQPIQPKGITQPVRTATVAPDIQTGSNQIDIVQRLQTLTADDMAILNPALPPSVKQVLAKIIPEITSLLEGIGTDEETIPIKFSVMDSLPEDIQNFILESNTPQMETNNVPLDTTADTTAQTSGMMTKQEPSLPEEAEEGMNYDQIDQGLTV